MPASSSDLARKLAVIEPSSSPADGRNGNQDRSAPNLYEFAIPVFTVRDDEKSRQSRSFERLLFRPTERDEVERLQHVSDQITADRVI